MARPAVSVIAPPAPGVPLSLTVTEKDALPFNSAAGRGVVPLGALLIELIVPERVIAGWADPSRVTRDRRVVVEGVSSRCAASSETVIAPLRASTSARKPHEPLAVENVRVPSSLTASAAG